MRRAQEANKRFARSFATLRAGVVSAVNPFHALGQGVAALAGAYGFVQLIRRGEEFNKAMAQSQAIMSGLTTTLREDMRRAAIEMSKTSIFSATESARAFFYLASAGLNAEQSIAALPVVTKFAQAGMFDLARATDLVTDAQSALGLTVKDAQKNLANMARVSDVLVKANTLANATVEQFSEALTTKAGAALRIVNKDIEEGIAVLAAFADQGVKGSDAGTAFSIIMRDLQTKALQNVAAFEKMNVTVFDSTGRMRNLADIIGDLENALDGMSDAQKKATLLALGFSDKSVAYVQSIIGMSDKIREYETELRKAGGTTARVANDNITPMQRALNALSGEWDDLAAGMGATNNIVVESIKLLTGLIKVAKTFGREIVYATAVIIGFKAGMMIGGVISAAVTAILNFRKALVAMTAASKAAAIGQAILLSFAGPAGWMQLAAGVITATAAVVGVAAAFSAASDDASDFSAQIERVNVSAAELQERMQAVAQQFAMPDLFSLKNADQLTEFVEQAKRDLEVLEAMMVRKTEFIKSLLGSRGEGSRSAGVQELLAERRELDDQIEALRELITQAELLRGQALETGEAVEMMIDEKAIADADRLAESLRQQIIELEMGADAAALYALSMRGVTEETLATIRALQEQLALLQEQEAIMREGERVWEETRTAQERYAAELERLKRLLDAGAIDWETYERAVKKAAEELERFQERDSEFAIAQRDDRAGEFRQVDLTRTAIGGVQASNREAQQNQLLLRKIDESIREFRRSLESKPIPVIAELS